MAAAGAKLQAACCAFSASQTRSSLQCHCRACHSRCEPNNVLGAGLFAQNSSHWQPKRLTARSTDVLALLTAPAGEPCSPTVHAHISSSGSYCSPASLLACCTDKLCHCAVCPGFWPHAQAAQSLQAHVALEAQLATAEPLECFVKVHRWACDSCWRDITSSWPPT